MKRSMFFWSLALACFSNLTGVAQVPAPEPIVDQQFPQALLAGDTTNLDRVSCFTVFDSMPDGSPNTIIAANGMAAISAILDQRRRGAQESCGHFYR